MDFYEAGLAAYAMEREQWAGHLGEISAEDRANPYYAWFLAGTEDAGRLDNANSQRTAP